MLKNKIISTVFFLLMGILIGHWFFNFQNPPFEKLNRAEMYDRIIKERNFAIDKAVVAGVYGCCIKPPCTMCYMEANQWNNFTAGTCACDDLIAQGKDPCPQCERGLCEAEEKGVCEIE